MTKVALYARYSSDNQRDASIEDQLRLCRLHAERQGWTITDSYTDRAMSGASLLRPGIQELIQDATRGLFTIVLAEAMDRLSRDQEDIAGLFKRMAFAGVKIVTLAEGEVSALHVGLKGTMNALFLKDLGDKTHRGLRGRVELGKSGGGNAYGYDVVRQPSADGLANRGDRIINETEAAVVRRIFQAYADGRSPKRIASALNETAVPAPGGGEWSFSTINGNRRRGTGILNNELYIGHLVWNRLRYIKDPDTGKRVSRLNSEADWVVQGVPDLRIVDQCLWDRVKERQAALNIDHDTGNANAFHERQRSKYLFSGLTKCGCCGGGYSMISGAHVGCSAARNKGTCQNRLNIRRDTLETRVLTALQKHLMDPALFAMFCEEFTHRMNERRMEARAALNAARADLQKIERELDRLVQHIAEGHGDGRAIGKRIAMLEARQDQLTASLASAEDPPPVLHPSMALVYRERVAALHDALQQEETRPRAAELIRSLVSRIVLTPAADGLRVELHGDLAGILAVAASGTAKPGTANSPRSFEAGCSDDLVEQVKMVAGAGFEPAAFRL
ncbi:recombinase family protein [Nitrospirillum pindoramense]|uniref:recombinase family protein n=1 Tax=Nitrospirillum amazonense TaxID=28077 RepID=UPI0011A6484E|nr:recombinase family protein [Nitrospirillum amazonense]